MVHRIAGGTAPTQRDPTNHGFHLNYQINDPAKHAIRLPKQFQKATGLHHCPGKAVEENAAGALVEFIGHDRKHQFVRNQLTPFHIAADDSP